MQAKPPAEARRIPRGARLAFTAWMCLWVPVVLWAYGPANFLWLCNLAQFLLLYAVWRGDALIASSQAGTVALVGVVWTLDFLAGLASGGALALFTGYMFDSDLPLVARAASLYHLGLPAFAVWLVHRIGYDRRGPWLQCGIGAAAVLAAWLATAPERNVNWVWAPFGASAPLDPHGLYVAALLVAYPVLIYWPGHLLVAAVLHRLPARRRIEAD